MDDDVSTPHHSSVKLTHDERVQFNALARSLREMDRSDAALVWPGGPGSTARPAPPTRQPPWRWWPWAGWRR